MRRLLSVLSILLLFVTPAHTGLIMRGSGGAASEWTFVGETSDYVPDLGGNATITLPGPPQEGDLVVVAGACDGDYNPTIDTSGYTTVIDSMTDTPLEWMIYKVMGATPDTTLSLTSGGGVDRRMPVVVQVWRGGYTSSIVDQSYSNNTYSDSAAPDPPSITTQNNYALVFAFGYMDDDDTTATAYPSGYTHGISKNTELSSDYMGSTVAMASKQVDTAGSENPGAFTFGASDQWRAGVMSFRRNP